MPERVAIGDVGNRADVKLDEAAPTRLADSVLARSTLNTYRDAVCRFDKWLSGRAPTDATLAEYLGALFDRGLAPAYASVAVAAAVLHARRGGEPAVAGERTARALTAFRRDGSGRGIGQVVGIRWEQADRMAALAEACGNTAGLRDALFIRIASDCLLRVGEVAALGVTDISFDNDGLTVVVRRSKTDQDARGSAHYAGPPAAQLLRLWLAATGIEEGPLFRPVNKAGAVAARRLGERSLRNIAKRRAAEAGIEGRVSGHSFRVGTAQSLRDAGATTSELMTVGRWRRVETMTGYIRVQDAAAGPVARLRYGVEPPDGRKSHTESRQAAKQARRTARRAKRAAKQSRRLLKGTKKVQKKLARLEKAVIGSRKEDLRNVA